MAHLISCPELSLTPELLNATGNTIGEGKLRVQGQNKKRHEEKQIRRLKYYFD